MVAGSRVREFRRALAVAAFAIAATVAGTGDANLIYTPSQTRPGGLPEGWQFGPGIALTPIQDVVAPDFVGAPAAGNFNGDDKVDIAFLRFFNIGQGEQFFFSFDPVTGTHLGPSMATTAFSTGFDMFVGDVDGDGLDDLLTVETQLLSPGPRQPTGVTDIYVNKFTSGFGISTNTIPNQFATLLSVWAAGDIDGDQIDDIVTLSQDSGGIDARDEPLSTASFYACKVAGLGGTGPASCTPLVEASVPPNAAGRYPSSVAVGDMDGNGANEVIIGWGTCCVPNDSATVRRYAPGNGTLTLLSEHNLSTPFQRLTAADLDGDHVDELILTVGGQTAGSGSVHVRRFNASTNGFDIVNAVTAPILVRNQTPIGLARLPPAVLTATDLPCNQAPPPGDRDGDGLSDVWEEQGVDRNCDGVIDINLPAMGANPDHKDLFLELFWIDGFEPNRDALQTMRASFARAPIDAGGVANPDGQPGINLWIDTGDLVDGMGNMVGDALGGAANRRARSVGVIPLPTGVRDPVFANVVAQYRDPNRIGITRFILAASGGQASTFRSGAGGDLAFVTVNTQNPGVLMHEFGHLLGLAHGGPQALVATNPDAARACKPNHFSVMSYIYQNGIGALQADMTTLTDFFDYSPSRVPDQDRIGLLPTLDESALVEDVPIFPSANGFVGQRIKFSNQSADNPTTMLVTRQLFEQLDWNGVRGIETGTVTANIDNFTVCEDGGAPGMVHSNYDEWTVLKLGPVSTVPRGADPLEALNASFVVEEPTAEEIEDLDRQTNATNLALTLAGAARICANDAASVDAVVRNLGPNLATQTRVDIRLPAGTTFLEGSAGCMLASLGNVVCRPGQVPIGGQVTMTVTFDVTAHLDPAARTVTANVADDAGADPDLTNNAAAFELHEGCWMAFCRERGRSGRTPLVGPTSDHVRWTFDTADRPGLDSHGQPVPQGPPEPIVSSPAVDGDGNIYFGSRNDRVYAVDAAGEKLWSFKTGGNVDSSPAVRRGIVFVGSDDDFVYALRAASGALVWKRRLGRNVGSSPAVALDGTVYVGSDDGRLYALSAGGTISWSFDTHQPVRSSPAVGPDGTIYVGSDARKVFALSPAGALKWSFAAFGAVRSTPAVTADVVYVGSDDGRVYALRASDGTKLWSANTHEPVTASPTIGGDGVVYVGSHDGRFYAFNPVNGAPKWSFKTQGKIRSSAALGGDAILSFGSDDGRIYALDAASGSLRWSRQTGADVQSSPAIGDGQTLYVGAGHGKLLAIGPEPTLASVVLESEAPAAGEPAAGCAVGPPASTGRRWPPLGWLVAAALIANARRRRRRD